MIRTDKTEGKRILFVVNNPDFFLSHRRELGLGAKALGMDVHVATPATTGWKQILQEGFSFHKISMSRSRGLPWQEVSTLIALVLLYQKLRPDIIHHVTIKPVIYGSLVARLLPGSSVVNAVSGLGTVFIAEGTWNRLRRFAVKGIYRLAFARARHRAIFQNLDDLRAFAEAGILKNGDGVIIKGSGVDPERFRMHPEPLGPPVVVLASRLLWDKGVGEFVAAASALKAKGVVARFILVGETDAGNPTSVPKTSLEKWQEQGVVEWWGHRKDIAEIFSQCHLVCLPSYREGLPKVLIEAAASGRAIVSTDVPGCREIVIHQKNGLLVPARSGLDLAAALETLILDTDLRKRMGAESRLLFERGFSIKHVVDQTMDLYSNLLEASGPFD